MFSLAVGLALAGWLHLITWQGALLVGGIFLATILAFQLLWPTTAADAVRPDEDVRKLQRDALLLDSLPQPVMMLDGSDRIEMANGSCRETFGEGLIGAHIASVVRAPAALAALREARHDNGTREAEFSITGPESVSALFHVAPVKRDEASRHGEFIVMIRDRTEQKKLERMRTDFIANAGHELRTPLAAILGFIETLQGHARNDPEARERFLTIMQSQTERLLRLVKDLVSLSALELNERRLPEDEVDLYEVAQTVRDLMAPVAAAVHGHIRPGPIGREARVMGDRDQLIQVVQNLVDNGLKYGTGPDEGAPQIEISVGRGSALAFANAEKSGDSPEQIAVRAGCRPEDLLFVRVRDFGPGIARTDLPRLTERFYRIDVERSHAKGGTGLGLAIVKHIVGRHRGGILVESKSGAGAAFSCYFPPLGISDEAAPAME